MKILAVEFSSERRSVALAKREQDGAEVLASAHEIGSRSIKAIEMIEHTLSVAEWRREQIECVAVGLGPGSYAGIRAAIALAQAWQLARGVRLLGLSSVDCLAWQAQTRGESGRLTFAIDAQRREFYIATYDLDMAPPREIEPLHIVSHAEVMGRVSSGGRLLSTGPVAGIDLAIEYPDAAVLARMAASRRDSMPGEKLEPIYLREVQFVKAAPPKTIA